MGAGRVGWRVRAPLTTPAPWWSFPLAGLAHAMLMALAFPPLGVWPVAGLAIWPLVWAGCHAGRLPAIKGVLTGLGVLPLWLFEQVWLVNVTEPGYPALALYMCIYPAAFVWLVGMARQTDWALPLSLIVPVAWTGLEVLRGDIVLTGYGFYLLGHPFIEVASLAAPAAVIGAYGVSFLISALAGSLADSAGWSGLPRRVGGIGAGVAAGVWIVLALIGERASRVGETFPVRVGVVQTNVPQDNKISWGITQKLSDFDKFCDLTRQVAATRPQPDVLIWPETMFPGYSLNATGVQAERDAGLVYNVDAKINPTGKVPSTVFYDELLKMQAELRVPMLVGAIATEGLEFGSSSDGRVRPTSKARYNSAFIVAGGAVEEARYDKVDLTPFGEVIPYVWRWPELQQRVLDLGARGMGFDLSAGTQETCLGLPLVSRDGDARPALVRVATPICFEVTRSGLVGRLVGVGANRAGFIVNLSNDGWFSFFDGGREAHLLAARWRCVELGVPMVRAVNTGVSAVIDRRGRIVGGLGTESTRRDGVIAATVQVARASVPTPYQRMGEHVWHAMSVVMLVGGVVLAVRRRTLARLGR